MPAITVSPQHRQQRKNLNGFSQPHVIGKAGPEPQFGKQEEPAHSHLLIGPQGGVQVRAWVDFGQPIRAAKTLQRLREPRAGHHFSPIGFRGGRAASRDIGSRHQPHCFPETKAVLGRFPFYFPELLHHPGQPLAIHFDPSSSYHRQAIGFPQQFPNFGGSQPLAIQHHFHLEIEQRFLADSRRGLASNGRRHPGP